MAVEGVALRKRQKIAKANRMMFMWIAGVSVVVGFAAVGSVFLVQKAFFNEKVLSEKSKTASILVKNNKTVGELQNQIRILNTNDNLKKAMVPGETQPVQVVLDALPSEANSSAFGASLQKKFLQADGIRLDTMNVEPVQDIETGTDIDATSTGSTVFDGDADNKINFSFEVSTGADNANGLKDLLIRLEQSIRPIDITSVVVEAQGDRLILKVAGHTYYEPPRTVELKDKTVKP
jgi:hypothetical protein